MNLEPPALDVFEITLLGRGFGEALVLHMGDNSWIVIDSFLTSDGIPAPTDYLNEMGVDQNAVQVILATHWHDDHVKGISSIYDASPEADFYMSLALARDEFAAFVGKQLEEGARPFSGGVTELVSVLEASENRRPIIMAEAAKTLYLRHASQTSFGRRIELVALSPSPNDVIAFLKEIQIEAESQEFATRLPNPLRNPASVACWAHFDEFSGLLGADLETSDTNSGWAAILSSRTLPDGPASYLKVPHHGSITGHYPGVWTDLLEPGVPAALAPWTLGGGRLPKDSDVDRIKSLAGTLYTAKAHPLMSYKSGPSPINKLISNEGAILQSFPKDYGIIQFRRGVSDSGWSVILGGGAIAL